jgi:NADPH2:quinone reductase
MQTEAILVRRHGGPEVLEPASVDVGAPGDGEVRIRQTSIGVNFVDVYHRTGQFHGEGPALPFVPGVAAAGVVEKLGSRVDSLAPGDRVTYANIGVDSYCGARVVPADRVVKIPAEVSDETVAAAFLRGLTCHYLVKRLYVVKPGDAILVHAAVGGVGQFLVQWAKTLGASVIGTVGSDAKAELARRLGCDHAIVYTRENFVERVQAITGGAGVPVVYDSVGRDTFMGSLECLAPMGIAINFGTASGQVEPFPMQHLHSRSLIVSRPTLRTWIAKRSDLEWASAEVFDLLASGRVKIEVSARFPLREARRAHELLEGRKTTGAVVLHA